MFKRSHVCRRNSVWWESRLGDIIITQWWVNQPIECSSSRSPWLAPGCSVSDHNSLHRSSTIGSSRSSLVPPTTHHQAIPTLATVLLQSAVCSLTLCNCLSCSLAIAVQLWGETSSQEVSLPHSCMNYTEHCHWPSSLALLVRWVEPAWSYD